MIKESIATASTIDEATSKAIELLDNAENADIQVEIISMPVKKTLGLFGGSPAKVRVYYDDGKPEPKSAPEVKQEEAKPSAKERKKEKKSADASKQSSSAELSPSTKRAVSYISGVISKMGVENVDITAEEKEEGGCNICLNGDNLGVVIGRRGETLDALQYLASLACNDEEKNFCRVVLDTGGYREKREQTLIALAQKTAGQAIKYHRNQALEPMNPYERRIIHTAVQDIEGISSWSVSDGRNRRVIIGFEKDSSASPVRNSYRGGRGRDRQRTGRRRDNQAAAAPAREQHKDADNLPLYGRIDK